MVSTLAFVFLVVYSLLLPADSLLIPPDNTTQLVLPSYDCIVVGGGVSGLVVANRLSEDSNVLVLEAGKLDASSAIVTVPGLIGHGFPPAYNWNLTTTPQEFLDNKARDYGQGHVVGGGSILNGIVTTRGARADYDAWHALGNPGWAWKDMLPYFKKSETFSADVSPERARTLNINPDQSVHGTSGPLEVTYPTFLYNQSTNFLRGLSELGVPLLADPNAGVAAGAVIAPASMSAANQSRMDSRRAYLDPVLHRPNLHLAVQQTVTRVLIETNGTADINVPPFGRLVRAYGVEYTTSAEAPRRQVLCNREVILAAGAIFSPALLQVSGIGPADVLNELNVPVKVDLPGVGQNFQDHPMVGVFYNYTKPGLFSTANLTGDTLLRAKESYFTNRTGPWTTPLITTLAFPHLTHLFPLNTTTANSSSSSLSLLLHFLLPTNTNNTTTTPLSPSPSSSISSTDLNHLPPSTLSNPPLLAGYTAQLALLTHLLTTDPTTSPLEIMADSLGTLTVSVQHPLSRGTVRALSADLLSSGGGGGGRGVADNVAVDPRYCSHAGDCALLVAGARFNGRIVGTEAMRELMPCPEPGLLLLPWDGDGDGNGDRDEGVRSENGGDVGGDWQERMLRMVKRRVQTEFHPSGTTAMMPVGLGGVVGPRLGVYGTVGLRVVDAGVMPLVVGAHLQAAVYAVAEKAADLIKEDYRRIAPADVPGPSKMNSTFVTGIHRARPHASHEEI